MHLRGQHGYAMVVLLVSMSIAAVLMSVVMPVWHQTIQREKETELVFRGNQYVRAIGLFQRRSGPGVLPPSLDVLVSNRFLRKKYKDPITGQDFDLLSPVQQGGAPGAAPGGAQPGRGATAPPGRGGTAAPPASSGAVVSSGAQAAAGGRGVAAGIIGVASKSKDASIRIYNGRTHYNEWQFLYVQTSNAPGASGQPGQPGQPGRGGVPPPGMNPGLPPPTGFPGGGLRGAPPAGRGRGGPPAGVTGNPPGQGGRGAAAPPTAPSQPAPGRGTQQPAPPTSPFAPRR
jgi:type II secretory pathway pseudopilin PulG